MAGRDKEHLYKTGQKSRLAGLASAGEEWQIASPNLSEKGDA
jgi:hypothetical protein